METRQRNSRVYVLLKKPSALFAFSIIGISIVIASFAQFLAPDSTPNANRMIVELSAKEPGFSKNILLVPIRGGRDTGSTQTAIPINAHWFHDSSIIVEHYIDDGIQDTLTFNIMEIAGNLPPKSIQDQQTFVEKQLIKSQTYYLGSDRYGRDILSRLLLGTRVSLAVGFIAVLLSITIGIIVGAFGGYYSGMADSITMWLINILWAIPTLLLVFAITLTIGKGFWQIFIAIGLTMWVNTARLIRGQVLAAKEMEYIRAVRAMGMGSARIIARHILPNIAGPLMVLAAGNFATAILLEAGLSFLGIGVQPPTPSWGLMIKEHYNFLLTNQPMLAIFPGLAIMLLVYAFNVLGNALRDSLDVQER